MDVSLIQITPDCERFIEKIGRKCYNSEHLITEDSHVKFIQNLLKRGHDSVLEHAVATFDIDGISRSCSHQLVRHRIAAHTQRSQRYCKEHDFDYVLPPSITSMEAGGLYYSIMVTLDEGYQELLRLGIKPEDARMILPNACCTTITTTMNFRSLRNFFKLRLDPHAQWEIRDLAEKMLAHVMKHAPTVFGDFIK